MTVKRWARHAVILALLAGLPASAQTSSALTDILNAKEAVARKDWGEAARLLDAVTRQTPSNGPYRLMLADAHFQLGDLRAAAADYGVALTLGAADPAILEYKIATCDIRMGEKEQALAALTRAMALGYRYLEAARSDAAFAPLRSDPRYRSLLGIIDKASMMRDEGWRYDIQFLADWVAKKPFHPFRTETGDRGLSGALYTRQEFEERIAQLRADVPKLSDAAIQVALMRLTASLGDGHTEMGPSPMDHSVHALPLGFYVFEDGVHVISAAPQYKALLGAKVVAVDGAPITDVLHKLDGVIARDNVMWLTTMEPHMLRQLLLLKELGVAHAGDKVTLRLEGANGKETRTEVTADGTEPNIWNMLPKPKEWVWIGDQSKADFQRDNNLPFWLKWDASTRILYVQYNNVFNTPSESLAQFAQRLADAIASNPVDKLVIDMRNNNGGNTYLNEPLLATVMMAAKVNRSGHLYVIIGRRTFSAAINAVSYFGKYTNAVFVGEPTGGKPNSVGDETFFTLPYSGMLVNLSDRYWQGSWPDDFSTWRAPDVAVPVRFADYAAGRDLAMEAIAGQTPPN